MLLLYAIIQPNTREGSEIYENEFSQVRIQSQGSGGLPGNQRTHPGAAAGERAIPYRRVGQRWLIARSALDDWLNKKN